MVRVGLLRVVLGKMFTEMSRVRCGRGRLFGFLKSEDVPPVQVAPLAVLHSSFFCFHYCARHCALPIWAGDILEAHDICSLRLFHDFLAREISQPQD